MGSSLHFTLWCGSHLGHGCLVMVQISRGLSRSPSSPVICTTFTTESGANFPPETHGLSKCCRKWRHKIGLFLISTQIRIKYIWSSHMYFLTFMRHIFRQIYRYLEQNITLWISRYCSLLLLERSARAELHQRQIEGWDSSILKCSTVLLSCSEW